MKIKLLASAVILLGSFQLFAQGNHVGTWKLVSAEFTDADGKTETFDHSVLIQTKIITPTHWMFIAQNPDSVDKEKRIFAYAAGGHYTLDGDKYVEIIEYASWDSYNKYQTDYTLRVEGDRLYQTGTLTDSEGGEMHLEEVYERDLGPEAEVVKK